MEMGYTSPVVKRVSCASSLCPKADRTDTRSGSLARSHWRLTRKRKPDAVMSRCGDSTRKSQGDEERYGGRDWHLAPER